MWLDEASTSRHQQESCCVVLFFFPFFCFFQMQVWYFLFFNISASSENNNALVGGAEAASAALESCLSCIWSRTLKDWGTGSNKPNARSHDPKARVPVLRMFSPSACAKQKSLKPRQLQASNEWILAASRACGIISKAGDRRHSLRIIES